VIKACLGKRGGYEVLEHQIKGMPIRRDYPYRADKFFPSLFHQFPEESTAGRIFISEVIMTRLTKG
jgi:hypothetical protein